jgi:hypothetical protein
MAEWGSFSPFKFVDPWKVPSLGHLRMTSWQWNDLFVVLNALKWQLTYLVRFFL